MGPGDRPDGKPSVEVLFPGNKGNTTCLVTHVSREPPPPLPGGYELGEKVYFTMASETFEDGYKVVHGQQGEVMGPGNRPDGK